MTQSNRSAIFLIENRFDPTNAHRQLEMAWAANSPVFGPSVTVLKQSASNFFSDDVIPGRYGPLQSARQNFLFFAKFHNLTKNIFAAVISILRFCQPSVSLVSMQISEPC